jgi:hypothetical protein
MPGSFIQQAQVSGAGGGGGGGGGGADGVPYSDVILAEPNLRHYYKLDEELPTLDHAGDVLDSKGTKHGTARVTIEGWKPPQNSSSDAYRATLAPDGRSKAPMWDPANWGGYVDLTADFGNDFMLDRNPFTFECWYLNNGFSNFSLPRLYSKEGGGFLVPYWMNSDGLVGIQRGASAKGFGGVSMGMHVWHHIVGTYDGDFVSFYQDGQNAQTVADSGVLAANGYVASIGAGGSKGGNETVRGAMCHVAFYDVALTDEQVRNHWNAMWKSAVKIV